MYEYTFLYDDKHTYKNQIYTKTFGDEKTVQELKEHFQNIPWVAESFNGVITLHTIVRNKPTGQVLWSS